ncbi:hypothetical protein COV93_07035 [Candidatus Woesearchaeota archaeon CG11_big_fil_rev_8_21_14_0_20_43_8]|nr:MAG: hypothetical protein COV93_07035 [Candidatus Woesearchaeota archaeon CG11_big_fil_rev_8_21_14_0_20_43_8]PIO04945.1 MAG: hypothetical protein COT47_06870 [Candidatus Woesearchaeota archaeon CG08_land_8_20_14_0_20_43_7]
MGLLKKITRMLVGEPPKREIKKVEVKIGLLKSWIEEHTEYKFEKVKSDIRDIISDLKESFDRLRECLKKIEDAKLQNENIPPKALQLMQGNREAFIMKHEQFMENTKMPEEFLYRPVMDFCRQMNDSLENLKKNTAKSNYVLMEFFGNEVNATNAVMKKIVDAINSIHNKLEAKSDELEMIDASKAKIDDFISKINLERQLYKKLKEHKDAFIKEKEQRDELQAAIERFKGLTEYKEVLALEETRAKAQKALQKEKDLLKQKMSPLSRPLKKFAHVAIENGDLASLYSDDPASALQKDSSLKILDVLGRIKDSLSNGKLDVKNDGKVIALIESLGKDFFLETKRSHDSLLEKKMEAERKIQLSSAMRDFEEMSYKLKHMDEKLDRNEREIIDLKKKVDKQDIDGEKERLQEFLSQRFNVDLLIVDHNGN